MVLCSMEKICHVWHGVSGKNFTILGNSMMFNVPSALRKQFAACLHEQAIPQRAQAAYHKWLRYYWDCCHTYHFPHDPKESLPHVLKKLQEKR